MERAEERRGERAGETEERLRGSAWSPECSGFADGIWIVVIFDHPAELRALLKHIYIYIYTHLRKIVFLIIYRQCIFLGFFLFLFFFRLLFKFFWPINELHPEQS